MTKVRAHIGLAVAALLAVVAVPLTATPVAADCSGPFCAAIRHASPDAGYDAPFKIRCNPPGPRGPWTKWLSEGEASSDGNRVCGNVTHVRLRNAQLHCDQRGNPFDDRRVKWKNATSTARWVDTDTVWSWDCTIQRA